MSVSSFSATPSDTSRPVPVTIPQAFEVDGQFYDLHIELQGDLVSLKDKIDSLRGKLTQQMGDCLKYCQTVGKGKLSDYKITRDASGRVSVTKNSAPMPNTTAITNKARPVFQSLETIARTPVDASLSALSLAPPAKKGWTKMGIATAVAGTAALATAGAVGYACYTNPATAAAVAGRMNDAKDFLWNNAPTKESAWAGVCALYNCGAGWASRAYNYFLPATK